MSKEAKGRPWHSATSKVWHDNSKCEQGKKDVPRIGGQGDKEHCAECRRLNTA